MARRPNPPRLNCHFCHMGATSSPRASSKRHPVDAQDHVPRLWTVRPRRHIETLQASPTPWSMPLRSLVRTPLFESRVRRELSETAGRRLGQVTPTLRGRTWPCTAGPQTFGPPVSDIAGSPEIARDLLPTGPRNPIVLKVRTHSVAHFSNPIQSALG